MFASVSPTYYVCMCVTFYVTVSLSLTVSLFLCLCDSLCHCLVTDNVCMTYFVCVTHYANQLENSEGGAAVGASDQMPESPRRHVFRFISAKEPYKSAQEPYNSAIETYASVK